MNKNLLIIAFGIFLLSFVSNDFLTEQKKFERVRSAIEDKQKTIEKILNRNQLHIDNFHLLFVAYKGNDALDIYAKTKQEVKYKKIHSYKICSRSGKLGPKRKQGDEQVPEGFYYVDRFNPASKFYLSLGINYPNSADKIKSNACNLGGDIFIHGSCATIGCLPMTNDYMKEIYLFAVYAKNNGQSKIPVYIFPFEMTDANYAIHKIINKNNEELIDFWSNLKTGYNKFMSNNKELSVKVDKDGNYVFL